MSIGCQEMVRIYLENNGYDGLFSDICGCLLDDLMPCGGEGAMDCQAGHRVDGCTETCGMGCDFHIQEEKP